MNLTAFDVYIVYQLDTIQHTLGGLAVALVILTIASALAWVHDDLGGKTLSVIASVCMFFIACATFCPSTDTMLKMIVVPELAKSRIVQADMPELYNLAVESLKKSLNPNAKPEN